MASSGSEKKSMPKYLEEEEEEEEEEEAAAAGGGGGEGGLSGLKELLPGVSCDGNVVASLTKEGVGIEEEVSAIDNIPAVVAVAAKKKKKQQHQLSGANDSYPIVYKRRSGRAAVARAEEEAEKEEDAKRCSTVARLSYSVVGGIVTPTTPPPPPPPPRKVGGIAEEEKKGQSPASLTKKTCGMGTMRKQLTLDALWKVEPRVKLEKSEGGGANVSGAEEAIQNPVIALLPGTKKNDAKTPVVVSVVDKDGGPALKRKRDDEQGSDKTAGSSRALENGNKPLRKKLESNHRHAYQQGSDLKKMMGSVAVELMPVRRRTEGVKPNGIKMGKKKMLRQSRLVSRKKLGSVASVISEKPPPPLPSPPTLILQANVQEEEDSSGDETETDVDLPVKVAGIREVKTCDASSEETETDEDLPAAAQKGACHVKQENDEQFENGFYARDCMYNSSIKSLNVRLQRRPSDAQTGLVKKQRKVPSLSAKRLLLLHQQLQSSSQKRKAVQVNQVVKSLWPVSPESQMQDKEHEKTPVASYSAKKIPPKKLQSMSSRKANERTTEDDVDDDDDDECKGEHGFSISRKRKCGTRVVRSTSRNHLPREQEQLHCNGRELHDDRRDCLKLSSSSEGTESDRDHEGVGGNKPHTCLELSLGCTGIAHLQKSGTIAPAAMEKHSLQRVGSRKNARRRKPSQLLHLRMLEQTVGMSEQKLTVPLVNAGKGSHKSCKDGQGFMGLEGPESSEETESDREVAVSHKSGSQGKVNTKMAAQLSDVRHCHAPSGSGSLLNHSEEGKESRLLLNLRESEDSGNSREQFLSRCSPDALKVKRLGKGFARAPAVAIHISKLESSASCMEKFRTSGNHLTKHGQRDMKMSRSPQAQLSEAGSEREPSVVGTQSPIFAQMNGKEHKKVATTLSMDELHDISDKTVQNHEWVPVEIESRNGHDKVEIEMVPVSTDLVLYTPELGSPVQIQHEEKEKAVLEPKNNLYRSPEQEVCTRTGELEAVSDLCRSPEREVHTRMEELEAVSDLYRSPEREACTTNHTCEKKMVELEAVSNVYRSPERKASMKNHTSEKRIGQPEAVSMLCRMTPRTRKLTDAMQKFLSQKARSRQWKEIDLSAVHPTALIGRSCKIFWPLDDEWYPGVIHDYQSQAHKHRIDYKDNEREWVILAKERVKLKVTPEELIEIKSSVEEQPSKQITPKPDLDGFAALAAGVDDHEGQLGHADLVWAKVKGYPMWPALVMDEEHAKLCQIEPATRTAMLPLQFFGSYDYARISSKKVVSFSRGLMLKLHAKCKRLAFEQGLAEVETYLKDHRLPETMLQLLDSQGDSAHGAIERQKHELQESWPDPDGAELIGKKRNHQTVGKNVGGLSSFPLNLGTLSVLSLGKVVKDSEHFHDQHYIWTEGYTAIRRYNSIRDPATIVGYRMEVVRNPCMLSVPMFRVTPDDELPIEGPSPSACWKKLYLKLQKAKEKSGKCFGPEHEKRHPWRSGAAMFGFSNPRVSKLIQGLPNARACTKFTNWLDKSPVQATTTAVLPVGYKPVNVSWKHLDRCTVCYLDEEYVDNLLLQCDKCRIMVHMNCYGELEPPDGDLWLCNLCRSDAPKVRPPCCLCPVTGGAMKKTTEGRWAHLMCAMWIPETCLVDVKRMEPVDGINAINKARWKLTCSVCKVPYGACIQCVVSNCKVAFHPLCARSAGFCMEVLEEKTRGNGETDLQLLAYCRRHKQPTSNTCEVMSSPHQARPDCMAYTPPTNTTGCARTEPYNAAARRGRREPEALAAALAKRLFVENLPYAVSGCQHGPPKRTNLPRGGSLWSWHWETQKAGPSLIPTVDLPISISCPADSEGVGEVVLSMSEKFRHMRSSVNQRLTFGKSAIHGWGVFTKQAHLANDMVIEYAGEVVRPVIADIRERRCYDSLVGAGTYMFRVDDERVVDATHTGTIGHLINHSCEPNCFSRVVTASGEDRIIIFAKRDIPPGEELTYDYRFMSKDEQLTCYCGCSGCRGSVNVNDADSEPCNLVLHLSELIKLTSTSRGHSH